MKNRQWLIADRPIGRGILETDFKAVVNDVPALNDGQVLVKVEYLGFDPALKGWMENIADYVAPTEIGEIMRGSGVGTVLDSKHPKFSSGDKVVGLLRWQDFSVMAGSDLNKVEDDELFTANLGILGTPGMTAYFGLTRIGKPNPGDTVLVSGAAGATGSVVGQLAKLAGCRTVGIAGGPKKNKWLLDEVGYDAVIDYKNEKVRDRLKEICPYSVDVFFDNVGGEILNDALAHIATKARVVVCGGISRYEIGQRPTGPGNYFNLIFRRASMEGFIVLDYMSEYKMAQTRMKKWIRNGDITYKEDIQEGFENIPKTLNRLFSGENFGKQILKMDAV